MTRRSVARSVKEWEGKSDDEDPPPRVKLRNFLAYDGRCQCGCGRPIRTGEPWQTDHKIALCNGGENRETNLVPILTEHHKKKTADDVALKSETYEHQLKHYGVKRKPKGRPMAGTRASGIRKRMDGTIERW